MASQRPPGRPFGCHYPSLLVHTGNGVREAPLSASTATPLFHPWRKKPNSRGVVGLEGAPWSGHGGWGKGTEGTQARSWTGRHPIHPHAQ